MYYTLALLPKDKIEEGLISIRKYIRDTGLNSAFSSFDKYFDDYWMQIIGTAEFSIYGFKRRTNNDMEVKNNYFFNFSFIKKIFFRP